MTAAVARFSPAEIETGHVTNKGRVSEVHGRARFEGDVSEVEVVGDATDLDIV